MAATVDVLSRGRLDLGLGIGWMPEEFTVAGATMAHRGARTAEYLEVLRRAWADGVTEFSGQYYQVPRGPDGAQAGAAARAADSARRAGAPAALRRAGRLADGWVTSSRTDLSRIGEGIAVVRGGRRGGGPGPGLDPDRVPRRGPAGAPVTVPEGGGRRAAVGQLRGHPRATRSGWPGRASPSCSTT